MLAFVKESPSVQKEIMDACYSHKDAPANVDADGVVIEDGDGLDDIQIDL